MTMLSLLPIFPLYYKGLTRFRPIFCKDLAHSISEIILRDIDENIIEFIGPEEMTLKEIIEKLLDSINKKRLLIPLPILVAKITTRIFEFLPKPLITMDQLRLLKYDNIPSGKFKTNFDLSLDANSKFIDEINKYSYMWKEEGEYSKKNLNKL